MTHQNLKLAVVVSSHGEVDQPSLSAYYKNMKHIFTHVSDVMPIPKLVRVIVPAIGALVQQRKFKREGYVSPMNRISEIQAQLIASELRKIVPAEIDLTVIHAFETTPPYTHDVLQSLQAVDGIVVLVMNPIQSDFTCGSICRFALKLFEEKTYTKLKVVNGLYKNDALMSIYVNHIDNTIQQLSLYTLDNMDKSALLIALHGTVVADAKGNPVNFQNGLLETERLFQLLKEKVINHSQYNFSFIEPAYLNHQVGGKWTEPTLSQTILKLKKNKVEQVYLFAAGYFADNSETEQHAQHVLKSHGFKTAHYIPCINDSLPFTSLMAHEILRSIDVLNNRQAFINFSSV